MVGVDRESLVETFERFGEPVYRVTAPSPVRRHGAVGHGRDHFELYFVAGTRKEWVQVDVRLKEQRREMLVLHVLSNDAIQSPLRFPLTVTVTGEEVTIPVDGTKMAFTAFVCNRIAVAVAEVEGRWLYLQAPKRILRRVVLEREKPSDLRRFLRRMDENLKNRETAAQRRGCG
jgi:hypothetical protein